MNKSQGGIQFTDDLTERQTMACTTGVLVALGPHAFEWDTDRLHKWEKDKPQCGMRVCFQKYSGQEYPGLDGELYRVMQDRCIAGTQGWAEKVEPSVTSGGNIIISSAEAA